jgi:hypothetical protein
MPALDIACSLYAHGHLNLLRGRRHLGLRSVRTLLAAHRTLGIALSLSPANLAAVRRVALAGHYTVKASIEVQAEPTTNTANGKPQTYHVTITLTWR